MNKTILILFTIVCFVSIPFLTSYKASVKASPETIYVQRGQSIQQAINNAKSGDTVYVYNGTYYENVTINKSMYLVGQNKDLTIIDGNKNGSVVSIKANNVTVEGFTIKGSAIGLFYGGIYIDHSSNNHIRHNKIVNNYDGICLRFSSNNIILDNAIFSNINDGVSLWFFSTNNRVLTNTIFLNGYYGIGLYSSSDNNIVLDNTVFSNNDGISLYSSSNNIVSSNTIKNNDKGASFYFSSNNNTIYHNTFNNTNQVEIVDSNNAWDNGYEGNYWSDYAGHDLNVDGIGDEPYIIDINNKDTHPLMGMFSDFTFTLQKGTYNVATICNSTISNFKLEIGPETGNRIVHFNVTGRDTTVGFCRVVIPTELMAHPYIVLVDVEEIIPTLLDVSNETYAYLYFTYTHSSHIITIISSKTLHLYNELLNKYDELAVDLQNVNTTYYDLLFNYSLLLGNSSQLQKSYLEHLFNYSLLLGNYSQLQKSYQELNTTYQEQLVDYSRNMQNIRNLMYIFAATTAIFLITAIYLSKHAHEKRTPFERQRIT